MMNPMIRRTLLCAALLLLAACDDPTTSPALHPPADPQPPLLQIGVSEPAATAAALPGMAAAVSAGLAYVSFAEGELEDGVSVRVGNATTQLLDQAVYLLNAGALDPVAITASVGDTIQVEVSYVNRSVTFLRMVVPARRPPRVIRTSPTRGRTDVALNAAVLVVFSEPIDRRTTTTETLRLSCGGAPVAGGIEFDSDLATAVRFVPEQELPASASCRLTVSANISDLSGDALQEALELDFGTGGGAVLQADFDASCSGLVCSFTDKTIDPGSGGSLVSHAWDFGDGRTSAHPSPFHTYASPGSYRVTLIVTDNGGAVGVAVKQIDVAPGVPSDRSGIYERDSAHGGAGRHSRYIIRRDGRFELHDMNGPDSTVYTGSWNLANSWGGAAYGEGDVILLDFDGFQDNTGCGLEGIGYFLRDAYLAVAYCGVMINAGLEEGMYTTTPGPHLQPSPTRDGQIAFVRDGRIYVANGDGSGATPVSDGPQDGSPAWSPDGQRIAFIREPLRGVHIMNADGSNVIRRTSLEVGVSHDFPTWSPDGEWIAFICSIGGEAMGVCRMKADDDGAAPVNITPGHNNYVSSPSWSPDGTRIAFGSDYAFWDFVGDIWVVAPDGSQPTNLRGGPSLGMPWQFQPAWSPDGQRLAYVECPSWEWSPCSSAVIAVMNSDGSGPMRLPATSGFQAPWSSGLIHPTWSPNGQVIAFGSPNGIEWVSADGTARGLIISNGHSPAWRP